MFSRVAWLGVVGVGKGAWAGFGFAMTGGGLALTVMSVIGGSWGGGGGGAGACTGLGGVGMMGVDVFSAGVIGGGVGRTCDKVGAAILGGSGGRMVGGGSMSSKSSNSGGGGRKGMSTSGLLSST